jgi:glutamate-1-semialdehyde 2,1-aminomutase
MAPSAIFTSVRHRGEDVTASEVAKVSIDPHEDLAIALRTAKARFIERHPTSLKLHEEAINSLPGGNTRTLLHTTPFPISIKSGSGYEVTDEDGHT